MKYAPTAEFWRLWHCDRDGVRRLQFHPRKNRGRWIVYWSGGGEEADECTRGDVVEHVAPQEVGAGVGDIESRECAVAPYGYQEGAIDRLCEILRARKRALDASDTGAGKTYIAAFVCRRMGLRPVVVCMKSAVGSWERALHAVGYEDDEIFVKNYEQYACGNCMGKYDGARFHVGAETLVIVDEVHRCKNRKTRNARLLGAIAASDAYVLLLSATACESPDNAGPIVSALGLCERGWMGERRWLIEHGCYPTGYGGRRLAFCGGREHLLKMHRELFPDCGVRLRIGDIPGFPPCQYVVDPITIGERERAQVDAALNNLRAMGLGEQLGAVDGVGRGGRLGDLQRERGVVERCKLPIIKEMIDDLVEEGKSVAVFVNFIATMEELKKMYGSRAVYVYGGQHVSERERAMELFQRDEVHVIILNGEAGGTSISLHDVRGERPRCSIVSPPWSAVTFKQILGRIHRVGGRSAVQQRILLVDGTIEADIAKKLKRKLENIKHINDAALADGDLI